MRVDVTPSIQVSKSSMRPVSHFCSTTSLSAWPVTAAAMRTSPSRVEQRALVLHEAPSRISSSRIAHVLRADIGQEARAGRD